MMKRASTQSLKDRLEAVRNRSIAYKADRLPGYLTRLWRRFPPPALARCAIQPDDIAQRRQHQGQSRLGDRLSIDTRHVAYGYATTRGRGKIDCVDAHSELLNQSQLRGPVEHRLRNGFEYMQQHLGIWKFVGELAVIPLIDLDNPKPLRRRGEAGIQTMMQKRLQLMYL